MNTEKKFQVVETIKEANRLVVLTVTADTAMAALLKMAGTSSDSVKRIGKVLVAGNFRVSTVAQA